MVHTLDVDAMLDAIEPRLFSEWMAYDQVEPFGDEWDCASHISATVNNSMARAWGGELRPTDDFKPPAFKTRDELETAAELERQSQALRDRREAEGR